MQDLDLTAAGRVIPNALDSIRRYSGLRWSGGQDETWAWRYYDAVPTAHDDTITEVDVLCAAALHPGLSRDDLRYFYAHRDDIAAWLAPLPRTLRMWEVRNDVVDHIASLPNALPGPSVALLSKVLHRKRPHLIPILDRHVVDWYRPVTGKRAATEAWGPIARTIRHDECDKARTMTMAIALTSLGRELWPNTPSDERPMISWLRAIDIAIWMASR